MTGYVFVTVMTHLWCKM